MGFSGKVAAMVRVSTDQQETASQRSVIQAWADREGVVVASWYEEIGRSRHMAMFSPTFEGMISDGEAREFDWLVVESKLRLGTRESDEYGFYATRLKRAGVRIWSVAQGELTARSDATILTNAVEDVTSVSELREKSRRAARGMYEVGKAGFWTGGQVPPFGYDLMCVGPDGRELFRSRLLGVHHRVVTYPGASPVELKGKGQRPGKREKIDRYRLVPSEDLTRLETVRRIFDIYTTEAISLTALGKRLNAERALLYGKPWSSAAIRNVLENPIYVGRRHFNRRTAAAYHRMSPDGSGYEDATYVGGKPAYRKLPKSEWVAPSVTDEGGRLVEDATFEAAARKLATINREVRPPRSAELWLAPFLSCGSCGGKMRGWAPTTGTAVRSYFCGTYDQEQKTFGKLQGGYSCRRNRVPAAKLEEWVGHFLVDHGAACEAEAGQVRALAEGSRGGGRLAELEVEQLAGVTSLAALFAEMRSFVEPRLSEAPSGWGLGSVAELSRLYSEFFEGDQAAVRSELLAAEEHLVRLLAQALYLDAGGPAHRLLLAQVSAAESQCLALEARLVTPQRRLDAVMQRILDAASEAAKVREIVASGANRAKAEALGRVVRRVVVHTRPNPKQGGSNMSDRLMFPDRWIMGAGGVISGTRR